MPAPKTPAEAAVLLAVLETEIAVHLEAGEIDKPTYESLKCKVDRAVETTSRVIAEEHLYGKGGDIYHLGGNAWGALVQAVPMHYARDVLSAANKLAKIKEATLRSHAFYLDCAAYVERYKGMAQQLVDLKAKIVSTKARRVAKVVAVEVERMRKFRESATLVAVLEAHIGAYVKRAGDLATAWFDAQIAALAAKEWDIDQVAPVPTRDASWATYQYDTERRAFFIAATDAGGEKGKIRRASAVKRTAYIDAAKTAAERSYMAWICKMIVKIGQPVTAANMVGDPWTGSTINLTTKDGGTQVWRTQMIINYSKYNRPFNQFPSRRTDA